MDKIKLLTYSVIALILLNICVIAFMVWRKPQPPFGPGHRNPKEIIIHRLSLDKQQVKSYEKLISWHRHRIDSIDNQIRKSKQQLFSLLAAAPIDKKKKDSIINLLATLEKETEQTHFKHFQDIKALCRDKQLEDFNELTHELAKLFGPPPPPKHE